MAGGGVTELDEGWAGKVGPAQSPAISMADPRDGVGGLAPCPLSPPQCPEPSCLCPVFPWKPVCSHVPRRVQGGSQPPTFHSRIFMAFISGVFKTCLT